MIPDPQLSLWIIACQACLRNGFNKYCNPCAETFREPIPLTEFYDGLS